jgi:hypothetical protein
MLELEQIDNFNSDMKKHLMDLVVQLRVIAGPDLEEGITLKIEYPDTPNIFFQIVVQEIGEDCVFEATDKKLH